MCEFLATFSLQRLSILDLRDNSGTITLDEFKNVFTANVSSSVVPFDFDW